MNLAFGDQPSWYGLVALLSLSFSTDSLYNLSGGNLLAAMFSHQSAGTSLTFLHDREANPITLVLRMALVVILRLVEARGTRSE